MKAQEVGCAVREKEETLDSKDKEIVFEWSGVLTLATIPQVWETRSRFFEKRSPLVFDLKDLKKTDSAAVAFFVSLLREAKTFGISIRFLNLPQTIIDIAHLVGLEALFGIVNRSSE